MLKGHLLKLGNVKKPTVLFFMHLLVYSGILTSTAFINLVVAPYHPWFLLIIVGWSGILTIHAQKVMKVANGD